MHDAHLHIMDVSFLNEMKAQDVSGMMNVASSREYRAFLSYQAVWSKLYYSAGIHPWDVEHTIWEDMAQIMDQAAFIGEIGLDNVWCEVDINKQMDVFEHSLFYACEQQKPVILHVKGLEKEALPLLKRYPNTYMVHWYSCEDYIKDYMDLDCYFTIGPSLYKDKAVEQVAKTISLQRLLIESDGLDALAWCEGRCVAYWEYSKFLKRTLSLLSQIRHVTNMERIVDQNFQRLLAHAGISK
ncbi:MAG: hydrolase TatD [Erysipelotrichaceae bacterium]|nr:hydrolase TatD [Erysipelotrichaceae bacterium]